MAPKHTRCMLPLLQCDLESSDVNRALGQSFSTFFQSWHPLKRCIITWHPNPKLYLLGLRKHGMMMSPSPWYHMGEYPPSHQHSSFTCESPCYFIAILLYMRFPPESPPSHKNFSPHQSPPFFTPESPHHFKTLFHLRSSPFTSESPHHIRVLSPPFTYSPAFISTPQLWHHGRGLEAEHFWTGSECPPCISVIPFHGVRRLAISTLTNCVRPGWLPCTMKTNDAFQRIGAGHCTSMPTLHCHNYAVPPSPSSASLILGRAWIWGNSPPQHHPRPGLVFCSQQRAANDSNEAKADGTGSYQLTQFLTWSTGIILHRYNNILLVIYITNQKGPNEHSLLLMFAYPLTVPDMIYFLWRKQKR